MGRLAKNDRQAVVNAIFYVAAAGRQWRAPPSCCPRGSTVHRHHLTWSREGTRERICDRLARLAREEMGRDEEPSAGEIDLRSVRGAATVTSATGGYGAGKRISGRESFGVVDTMGLLVGVVVAAASVSDHAGGRAVTERVGAKTGRLVKVFCDGGLKKALGERREGLGITTEVLSRIASGRVEVLPRRWVVERTWSWLVDKQPPAPGRRRERSEDRRRMRLGGPQQTSPGSAH